jgi:NADPH2:quinone reductase
MRAVVLEGFGSELLLLDVPRPVPAPGEVLVRVAASGVNPLDTKIRAGAAAHARVTPPMILGIDLAGVIVEVGPGVTGFAVGDGLRDDRRRRRPPRQPGRVRGG